MAPVLDLDVRARPAETVARRKSGYVCLGVDVADKDPSRIDTAVIGDRLGSRTLDLDESRLDQCPDFVLVGIPDHPCHAVKRR